MKLNIIEIQGHRGARGLMPENTIPAFIKAMELGVNTLELDVVISKDHKVVVSHEPYFNPDISTTPIGEHVINATDHNLYTMDYNYIRLFDVGKRGNPKYKEQKKIATYKPLLSEVFEEVEKYCTAKNLPLPKYNIEIKSEEKEYGISQPNVPEFCTLVLAEIKDRKGICIQSFDMNVLKYLHVLKDKKFVLSVLLEPLDENRIMPVIEKLGFTPDIWSPFYLTLTKKRISELHKLGIKVIPWTVNDITSMKRMIDWKVDGIITDYPDRIKTLL